MIDELAAELEGTAVVGKVNIGNEMELAVKFSITGVPTLLVFKDGNVVERKTGMMPKDQLQKMIAAHS